MTSEISKMALVVSVKSLTPKLILTFLTSNSDLPGLLNPSLAFCQEKSERTFWWRQGHFWNFEGSFV